MKDKRIMYFGVILLEVILLVLVNLYGKDDLGKGYGTGFISTILLFTLYCFACTFKKNKPAAEYDERQELARGKCYKYAFFTYLFLLVLNIFVTQVFDLVWATEIAKSYIMLCIGVMVFVITAIINDAYYVVNYKQGIKFFIGVAILSLLFLGLGIYMIVEGEAVTDNMLDMKSFPLFGGIALIPIWITGIIKEFRREPEDEEEWKTSD